ncbi:HigA family addiction module antitoxin [Desulfovibrio piger]
MGVIMERTRKPALPGEILKEMYLDPLGLTITDFAGRIGVSRKTVSAIVNGHSPVTVDMALRLSRAFSTTPDLWLNLQRAVDLWEARQRHGSWTQVQPIAQPA